MQIRPLYLVCDESNSMSGDPVEAVNEGIKQLCQTIGRDPLVDDMARVGIISFSDSAEVLLPLTQISQVGTIPACVTKGSTSYRAAFLKLKDEIDADVTNLKNNDAKVGRPVVFFISDGAPNPEDWLSAHTALVEEANPWRPVVVGLGVAGANREVIQSVAANSRGALERTYFADQGLGLGDATEAWCQSLVGAWVQPSPRSVTPGTQPRHPKPPKA